VQTPREVGRRHGNLVQTRASLALPFVISVPRLVSAYYKLDDEFTNIPAHTPTCMHNSLISATNLFTLES